MQYPSPPRHDLYEGQRYLWNSQTIRNSSNGLFHKYLVTISINDIWSLGSDHYASFSFLFNSVLWIIVVAYIVNIPRLISLNSFAFSSSNSIWNLSKYHHIMKIELTQLSNCIWLNIQFWFPWCIAIYFWFWILCFKRKWGFLHHSFIIINTSQDTLRSCSVPSVSYSITQGAISTICIHRVLG